MPEWLNNQKYQWSRKKYLARKQGTIGIIWQVAKNTRHNHHCSLLTQNKFGKLTLTFYSFTVIVGPGWAIFGAHPFVQFGVERWAALAVILHRPWTGATGRVALATAAFLHILVITAGATGPAGPVQHQIEETAFWNNHTNGRPCSILLSMRLIWKLSWADSW